MFWRGGSRNVFAVESQQVASRKVPGPSISKKQKTSKYDQEGMCDIEVKEELQEIKEELKKYRKLAFKHQFSLSFLSVIEEVFECVICERSPTILPLIGCSSCSSLVVCEACVNDWFGNDISKTCPKRRTPRGLTKSFVLKGFNDLTAQINVLNASLANLNDKLPVTNNQLEEGSWRGFLRKAIPNFVFHSFSNYLNYLTLARSGVYSTLLFYKLLQKKIRI